MRKFVMPLLTALLVFSLTQNVHAEKILRLTLQMPATHHLTKNVQAFADEVSAKTNGEIKIEIYPSAQLYKDKEVPQAVSSGAVDLGVVPLTQFVGTIPAVDLFYVPFLFPSKEALDKAVAKGSSIRQPLDDAILATGARVLWWQAYGGAVFLSKDEPIRVPADLKGKKVRTFSKTLGAMVEDAGGAPTAISGSEQFLAYQRGTVDVGLTGVTAVAKRKLFQVMDYLTATSNMVDVEFVVLINETGWQKLTPEERQIMEAAAAKVEKDLRDKMDKLEADALAFSSEKMKTSELTADELEQWRKLSKPVVDTYVKNAGSLGQQLIDAVSKL